MAVLTLERLLASMGFGSRKDARGLVRMGLVELASFLVFPKPACCLTGSGALCLSPDRGVRGMSY